MLVRRVSYKIKNDFVHAYIEAQYLVDMINYYDGPIPNSKEPWDFVAPYLVIRGNRWQYKFHWTCFLSETLAEQVEQVLINIGR